MKSPSDTDNSSNPDLEGVVLLKDDGKKYLWDNPLNVKKFIKGFFLVCLVPHSTSSFVVCVLCVRALVCFVMLYESSRRKPG